MKRSCFNGLQLFISPVIFRLQISWMSNKANKKEYKDAKETQKMHYLSMIITHLTAGSDDSFSNPGVNDVTNWR